MRNHDGTMLREQVDRLGRPAEEMLDHEIMRLDRREAYTRLARDILFGLVAAAAVIIIAMNLWVAVLQVDGTSMNPLLQLEDIILAVKTGTPGRQEVISFYYNNKVFVKRVIGTPGDWIDISSEGIVSVNGNALNEPYVTEPGLGECSIQLPYQVPSGTVFVMGDNRPASKDSRGQLGSIDKEMIIGKVVFKLWPLSRVGRVV